METVTRSLILPYSTAEMHSLVDDVDRYQEFLPWCKHSAVLENKDKEVIAQIVVSFQGMRAANTTSNSSFSTQRITMELVEGPFNYFSGDWEFLYLDTNACRVSLEVQFSLAGKLANRTLTPVFKTICSTLVGSFADRAKELYGERQFT